MDSFALCKQHETAFKEGRLTMAEFERELAYVALLFIDDLRFRPDPTPPREVIDYRQATKEKQKKATEDGFWRDGQNFAWLEASRAIWEKNRGNLYRLTELKRIIPKEDTVSQAKIERELKYFTDFIYKENERAGYLRSEIDFEAEERSKTKKPLEVLPEEAFDAASQAGWGN